ncbi:hypothetical protein KSX_92180 [Ktedonospora formicarum]|uniref:Protein kinase domain-containing protein n=1 Tax=Ktedonospora formicarum TaxID=2778364 RepID=A0A8J3MX46_9CHLR|nr:hypothetical protein KSX_92180 [Ktedonospora formicarum]
MVEYVSQIADALHFAHLHHVVHRDVKPENILFGRHGELLLSDFGIAIMVRDLSPKGQHVAGTAAYMAPEQVQRQPVPASDQYALAVMAYEWLCGERPFRGSSAQVMLQHLTALPPAFPHILVLPSGVERVIHKALAKDPEARFASVLEFSQALRAASGLSVSTPVTISDITLPNQVDANLETTISDVDVAALQDVSMPSSSKNKLERIVLFPLRRGPFERRGTLIFLIASAFPLLLLLPTLIGNGALTSYMNENQLPSLSFLTWQLLIGPIVGSKRAPLVVAFVYMFVLVPLLVQGRVAIFAALGATLAQMIIAAGAGIWQERQKSYHFLSSLLLALVSIALSTLSHSFMFQQPLFCPFISISASQPASYTFIPILAVLLASSMEWIVFLCVPSLRRLPQSPETTQQPRRGIHDLRTQ